MIKKLCSLALVLMATIASGCFYNKNEQVVQVSGSSAVSLTDSPKLPLENEITSRISESASCEVLSQAPPVISEKEKTVYETLYPSFSPDIKEIPIDVVNNKSTELGISDNSYNKHIA